jgi:hypothetical protein
LSLNVRGKFGIFEGGFKMWKILAAVGAAMTIVVMGLVGAAAGAQDTYAKGEAAGRSAVLSSKAKETKLAFEKGQKAGVDYEQWFCENPQYDKSK